MKMRRKLIIIAVLSGLCFNLALVGGCATDAQTGALVGAAAGAGIVAVSGGGGLAIVAGGAIGGAAGYIIVDQQE